MKHLHIFFLCLFTSTLWAQVNYTANDQVPPHNSPFRFGTNMGAYSNWTDDDLANISIGNPALGLPGAGVTSLRPILPEYFLETWGYDIRVNTFQHYASLGADENTVFVGYPSPGHQDPTQYCAGVQSQLFSGLYEDIWDGGANGTPVNENNYYAAYLYQTVSRYQGQVKFWEIWNEPDLDFSGNGWKPKGTEGNWFQNVPEPCDYALRAPIFHYIRLLRISYEIVKTVDPSAYVAVGGLGYPGFLDLILRHSDNPDNGKVNAAYPLKGGAYFDVLSYHSYPHFDGSLRYWSDEEGGFVYTRNSDEATNGVIKKKNEFQSVLRDYGYDGTSFPEKLWIITESNLPRKAFGEFIGSSSAQRNFLLKTLVACQQQNIHQFHLYNLAESATEAEAANEFQLMGLFKKLEGTLPYQQQENEVAVAGRTFKQLLYGWRYAPEQTARLQVSNKVQGAAFLNEATGEYSYVLWARTKRDQSENASAKYSFPGEMGILQVVKKDWDYSVTNQATVLEAVEIQLDGSPVFLTPATITSAEPTVKPLVQFNISPNPATESQLEISLAEEMDLQIKVYNAQGQLIEVLLDGLPTAPGHYQWKIGKPSWPAGIYYVRWGTSQGQQVLPWVKIPE